jgi:DNA-binding beta-propeller fold protein YncE
MRLLALCAFFVGACVPSAPGAGCAPVTCGSSQVTLAQGKLLGIRAFGSTGTLRVVDLRTGATRWRLPSGVLGANLLVHQDGTLLTWFNASTGARVGDTIAQTRGNFFLTGVSQDGTRAVLARTQRRSTTFVIASRTGQRRIVLGKNNWSFDALSGTKLYLLQYLKQGYVVRLYDLETNKLVAQPLKDANEAAVISGVPWVRQSSADGRYLFTIYISSSGAAMVHQLDVRAGIAKCIDLPGNGDFNSGTTYSLAASADGSTLWAVSPGYGKVAAIDVAQSRVRQTFDFQAATAKGPTGGVAAMSPDGERLAVGSGGRLWFVGLAQRRVEAQPHIAIALGFSPNGKKLWTLGQRSRVTAVSVPGIR